MFDLGRLLPFALAAFALVLVPGPAQAMVVARSLNGGRRAGITASFGLNTGTMIHALAAGVGLSAILATSAVAFSIVKLVGAGYLIYLGVRLLMNNVHGAQPQEATETFAPRKNGRGEYARAVITGVLNPKVAIFFLAFLPQFVDREAGSVFLQFIMLGLIFSFLAIMFDCVLASAAGSLGRFLARNPTVARWRERITGGAFVGLGVRLAFVNR